MIVFTILAFAAGFALVFGINLLYADVQRVRERQLQEQIQREQQLVQRERARAAVANRQLYELAALSAAGTANRKTLRERLGLFFEQSAVRQRPEQILMMTFGAATAGAATVWFLTGSWLFAVLGGIAAGAAPIAYVMAARRRRMDRLLTLLPEAFDTISRMMRAGRTFPQAMQATAENGSPPLSGEFGYCCDQQQLGMPPDAALRDLARRTGLLEVKIFVLAVSIHRQSGGNLADLLEKLADVIRARQQIRSLISTLTAEGRFQVYVLTALPIVALAVMAYLSPVNAQELFDRPWILATTSVAIVLGWVWMNRIVNFSY